MIICKDIVKNIKKPDMSTMLPSKAKAALTEYFLACLEKCGPMLMNVKPRFDLSDAYSVMRDEYNSQFLGSIITPCYEEAVKLWEIKHPIVQNEDGFYTRS